MYDTIIQYIVLFMFILVLILYYLLKKEVKNKQYYNNLNVGFNKKENYEQKLYFNNNLYLPKDFMTKCELNFYNKMKILENEYYIIPQINLSTIISKVGGKTRNELNRNIDFGIFDKDFTRVILLIELNDSSHNTPDRKKRDRKVREICNKANISLITFYTKYPNEEYYVVNRIKDEINKVLNNKN